MDLSRLIHALTDPAAYPDAVDAVEVHQTHISVVFLAGGHAYKIKKPLVGGFLDYGTLDLRRHFCAEEVRLNRRLAPSVYEGVVPVTSDGSGVRMEGRGEVVEWAVKMRRLPAAARLGARLGRGEVGQAHVEQLARRLAEFHALADAGPSVAAFGRLAVVSRNALENFDQSVGHVGTTLSRTVFDAIRTLTARALESLGPVIEARAARGIPREGHGDLRLDHVYLFPERPPPADLSIIDCIEFDARYRCADPVADLAFLVMDFAFEGRRDLGKALADAYFAASGDAEGRLLLPFYRAYRAAVRGKVEGMELAEPEVPQAERDSALTRARAHWLLALAELQEVDRRPCLILVGGLPGAGKSTLARGLADRAGFAVVRSDLVRKDLAGIARAQAAPSAYASGIYTPEMTERTYAECQRRAEALLFEGERVLVDASFLRESHRRAFLEAAERWRVPCRLLLCRADPAVIQDRLRRRTGDASDADWSTYQRAAESWEDPGALTSPSTAAIRSDSSPEDALAQALAVLRAAGVAGPAQA